MFRNVQLTNNVIPKIKTTLDQIKGLLKDPTVKTLTRWSAEKDEDHETFPVKPSFFKPLL